MYYDIYPKEKPPQGNSQKPNTPNNKTWKLKLEFKYVGLCCYLIDLGKRKEEGKVSFVFIN